MGLERTLSNVHFFHFFHLFYRLLRIFTFRLHVQGRRRRRRRTVPTSHTTTRSIMYVFFSYCLFFSFTNGFLLDNIYRDYDYYERLPSHTHNPPLRTATMWRHGHYHYQRVHYTSTASTSTRQGLRQWPTALITHIATPPPGQPLYQTMVTTIVNASTHNS